MYGHRIFAKGADFQVKASYSKDAKDVRRTLAKDDPANSAREQR